MEKINTDNRFVSLFNHIVVFLHIIIFFHFDFRCTIAHPCITRIKMLSDIYLLIFVFILVIGPIFFCVRNILFIFKKHMSVMLAILYWRSSYVNKSKFHTMFFLTTYWSLLAYCYPLGPCGFRSCMTTSFRNIS